MKLANLIRSNDRGATTLGLSILLIIGSTTVGVVATATSASAGSGTVVLDGKDLADPNDRGNEPKLTCDIPVQFKGFADGVMQTATVTFAGQGADQGNALTVHGQTTLTFPGVGAGVAAFETYYVTGAEHIKVTFDVQPDGFTDFKVFKLEPCALSGSVAKTVDADGDGDFTESELAAAPGADVPFKAVVTNSSPLPVTLASLTDAYPASGLLPGDAGSAPSCFTGPALAVAAPALPQLLPAGGTYTCYFKVNAYAGAFGASRVNTVTATLTSPGSTTITPKDTATTRSPAAPGAPTLSGRVTKTVDADGNGADNFAATSEAPAPAQTVKFKVVVENTTAGHDVTLESLSDAYPAAGGGTTTLTPSCFTTSAMNVAAAVLPQTLTPNATYTCYFQVANYSPPAGGSLENTVTAQLTKPGSSTIEPVGKAITTTAAAAAVAPSLAVVKSNDANRDGTFSASETVTSAGANVPFQAVITNNSNYDVQISAISDAIDGAAGVGVACVPAVTSILANSSATCSFTLNWYSPADGATKRNTISVTANQTGNANNASTVASNESLVRTAVPFIPPPPPLPVADLAIKKTGPASASPGSNVTWTLTVTNKGPGNADAFSVTDTLPAGVTLVSAAGTGFTCTVAGLCSFPAGLVPGATATVTVVGAVASDVVGSSLANVGVVNYADATPADNTDTLVSVIDRPANPADLVLVKSAPAAAVTAGDPITWTITVTNAGASPATAFAVTDPLVDGVALVSTSGDGFVCDATATLSCQFAAPLAPGATATLLVTVALSEDYAASSVTNTATAVMAGDPTPENNTDTATTGVNLPFSGGDAEPATESPSPSPLPILPFVPEPEGQGEGVVLPFTGSSTDLLLGLGAGLSVLGLLLALTGRRRRTAE